MISGAQDILLKLASGYQTLKFVLLNLVRANTSPSGSQLTTKEQYSILLADDSLATQSHYSL